MVSEEYVWSRMESPLTIVTSDTSVNCLFCSQTLDNGDLKHQLAVQASTGLKCVTFFKIVCKCVYIYITVYRLSTIFQHVVNVA